MAVLKALPSLLAPITRNLNFIREKKGGLGRLGLGLSVPECPAVRFLNPVFPMSFFILVGELVREVSEW